MQRIVWADSLKGWLILLVVLGHSIQYTMRDCYDDNHLWNYIYSFHMPAFMAVSGYLSYRGGRSKNRLSILHRRCFQLLIPYLLWEVIYYLTKGGISVSSMENIFLRPYFWFLWVLFFIIVTFQLGDWISEKLKIKQEFIIIGLCLLYSAIMVLGEIRVLGFQFIAYYFMFYIFGYYIHKYPNLFMPNNGLMAMMVLVWALMAWYWNMHELPPFLSSTPLPSTMMQYAYRFMTGLIAIVVIMYSAPKMLDIIATWNKPFIQLGQISLGIYVVHLLLIPHITKKVGNIFDNTGVIVAVSFLIALMISWVVVCLLSRWKVTATLLMGKV